MQRRTPQGQQRQGQGQQRQGQQRQGAAKGRQSIDRPDIHQEIQLTIDEKRGKNGQVIYTMSKTYGDKGRKIIYGFFRNEPDAEECKSFLKGLSPVVLQRVFSSQGDDFKQVKVLGIKSRPDSHGNSIIIRYTVRKRGTNGANYGSFLTKIQAENHARLIDYLFDNCKEMLKINNINPHVIKRKGHLRTGSTQQEMQQEMQQEQREGGGGGRKKTSIYKGVRLNKKGNKKKWRVVVWSQKRPVELGSFTTQEDAARAYDQGASMILGDKAELNFDPKTGQPNPHVIKRMQESMQQGTYMPQDMLLALDDFNPLQQQQQQQQEGGGARSKQKTRGPLPTSGNVTTGQQLQRGQGRQDQGQRVGRQVQQGDFDVDDFVDQGMTYDPRHIFGRDQGRGGGGARPKQKTSGPPPTSGNVTTGQSSQQRQRRQGRLGQGQHYDLGDFNVGDFVDQGTTYDPRHIFEQDQEQGGGGAPPRGRSGDRAGSRG